MHVWARVLAASIPAGTAVDAAEPSVASLARAAGFGPDDPRPWVVFARHLLGSKMPLDRGRCRSLQDRTRRRVCRDATRDLFHDRLNHARDTRTFPCDGGPMPSLLAHTADAELEAILAERRAGDLCP